MNFAKNNCIQRLKSILSYNQTFVEKATHLTQKEPALNLLDHIIPMLKDCCFLDLFYLQDL